MEHDAVPAAAQISQADIIERQAESIAKLQRQVKKGGAYKQLTKSKLKEAAARLKEYRLRVEALLQETETLKRQAKEQDKALKQQKRQAAKVTKLVKNEATQTEAKGTMARTSQTTLSGDVVNRRAVKDSGVQTETVRVDALMPKRKRGRDAAVGEDGKLVPKLSRQVEVDRKESIRETWTPQPLQMNSAAPHETSSALDAALAFSESEDESGDRMEIDSAQAAAHGDAGAAGLRAPVGFDATLLDEIDKELQTSSDEEEESATAGQTQTGSDSAGKRTADATKKDAATGHVGKAPSLLGRVDAAVFSEIDKDLATSSDEDEDNDDPSGNEASGAERKARGQRASGAGPALDDKVEVADTGVGNRPAEAAAKPPAESPRLGGLDPAISSAIDKDLEFSSDDDAADRGNPDTTTTASTASRTAPTDAGAPQSKPTLLSIDDELDDEFAAMDSDSSSDSSDSDSSDSSDSESDQNGDDSMTGGADKNEASVALDGADAQAGKSPPENSSLLALPSSAPAHDTAQVSLQPAAEKEPPQSAVQQPVAGGCRASPSVTIPNAPVVASIPVETESLATTEVFSPVVEEQTQPLAFRPSQPDASAATAHGDNRRGGSTGPLPSSTSTNQQQVPDAIRPSTAAGEHVFADEDTTSDTGKRSSSDASSSTLPPSKEAEAEQLADKQTQPNVDGSSRNTSAVPLPTAAPSELPAAEAKPASPTEQAATTSPPSKDSVVGKPRKADEANLDATPAASQKKAKLAGEEVQTPRTTAAVKKRAAPPTETKEEQRVKKSLTAFKQAIVLGKLEEADKEYARRTITVLVNQSSKFIDSHLSHVATLCQVLAEAYRKLDVSPMMVVRGALGVFRTPRSRRLLQENKMGLTWLCNQLLVRLVCSGEQAPRQDGSDASGSLSLSLVHECLLHLRGLLVEERSNLGDGLSESKLQVAVATQKINVSHDKVFLAHICALHTHLCQSSGQLARSRVLLFDLLRANLNIRGLYFAMTMVEVDPAILKREFDEHCMERHWLLKDTLQQVVIFISSVAAANEELLLHQSSLTMMHRIAEAIDMPELEEVDGSDPSFPRACVEQLFAKFATACQASSAETPAQFFEIAKSLELCTAVFGLERIAEFFRVERCQELFSSADSEGKAGIVSVVGHIAAATAPKTTAMRGAKTPSEQYVESFLDWLHRILSTETTDDSTSPADAFKLRLQCATVGVELMLEYSAGSGLKTRHRVLCAVVEWFDATPPEQLMDLPASFLRRLRLAVVAARPQVVPRPS